MTDSRGHAVNSGGRILNIGKSVRVWALVIAFTMIATPFIAVVSHADTQAEIWTSKDEYLPGETVMVFGKGFVPFVPVTVNMTHSDFETRIYYVEPDVYGRFVLDDYIAEWVSTADEPVVVTARQVSTSGVLEATTQFMDPAAYIQGYTLRPTMRWTTGDVKGYIEGDSVPMEVALNKNQLGGVSSVDVTIGVDFIDLNYVLPRYGFDYLTQYWVDPPAAPFNIYTNSSMPFYVDPSEGTVSGQTRLANIYDSGGNQLVQVWKFTLTFASGAAEAFVKFGAHLALTNLPADYLGASYYSGSSLHVRIVALNPGADFGNRDVPIALADVLTPPDMNLEKSCDPCRVVEGDVITFTVHFNNTGQANAGCVELEDWLDDVVDIIPGSFLFWTSDNPTPMPPSPGPVVTGNDWYWYIGYWRGTGPDDSLPPLEGYLQYQGVVTTNEPGCYYNHVYLNYSDDHGGMYPMEHAWCRFCIIAEPLIDIEKSGPDYAHVGDTITYTYVVTNTGDVDLVDVDIADDVAGTVATDQTLLVGESKTYTLSYTITVSDPDHLFNEVTATGEDEYGRTTTDTDTWEVDILHPEIIVEKTADKACAKVGEEVWYAIGVGNPSSDTDLYNVVVVDTIFGTIWTGTLLAGQSEIWLIPYFVTEDYGDPLVNVVTASGEDLLGLVVSDEASWEIDILHPMIEITKEADKTCAAAGETVLYWINVSNPSTDTMMYFVAYDYMLSPDPLAMGWIAPLDVIYLGPYAFQVPFGWEWVENIAWVDAWDEQEHYVYDEASWLVEVLYPDVVVDKRSDWTCAAEGETVWYTVTVSNTGDTPLSGWVYDPYTGFYADFWDLAPGLSISWRTSMVIPAGDEFTNWVYVEAYDRQDHMVWDEDFWTIEIRHPMIDVEKYADVGECAAVGDTIIYTIVVSNPSVDTWMTYDVYDVMLGWGASGSLGPGDFDIYYVPYLVTGLTPDPLINEVWVDAYDDQYWGADEYWLHYAYDWDEWWIDIYHPMIDVEKWADVGECAAIGDTIVYTIVVYNPSPDTWMNYYVYDYFFLWGASGYLAPGESHTYTLTYLVTEQTPDPLYNYVDVWGYDDQWWSSQEPWNHEAWDWDEWWIDIYHPMIDVEKWADVGECAAIGDTIVYTIVVYNPSPDTWMNYDVYDYFLLWGASGYLAPGDSDTYYITYLVTEFTPDPLINEVWVEAWDDQYWTSWEWWNHYVTDWDEWWIDIYHPMIDVEKYADVGECAAIGDTIVYTIVVYNPSPDTWMNYYVYDYVLGWSASGYLAPGASDIYYVTYLVTVLTPDPLINEVWVEAWDDQYWTSWEWWNHYVTDWDDWWIDIYRPMIDVEKWADVGECAGIGDLITYTIVVSNPSPDTWMNYEVYDYYLLWGASGYLAPGESHTYTLTYLVTVNTPDPLYNYVEVWGYDDQYWYSQEPWNHEAWDWDEWWIDIVHPEIDITKWGDMYAHEGDTVYYEIVVTNTGDIDLTGTIYDSLLGISQPFAGLAPGVSIYLYPTYVVPVDTEWVYNYAWVEAYDRQNHYVEDAADWWVEIIHPSINVTKTGPEYASVGDTITYYVTVTNTGDTPLYYVDVYDTLLAAYVAYFPVLDVGESRDITYTYTVPPGEGGIDNTVIAWGWDLLGWYVEDWDSWTVLKYSKVTGYKYADLDRDGVMDGLEPGLINWLIVLNGTLDDGGYDNRTRLTDSGGYYEFSMLRTGVYVVSEVMLAGWKNITVTSYTMMVGSGQAFSRSFGNIPNGNISGHKWWDLDLDGIWDENENPIPGWTIYLTGVDANGDVISLVALTDADGYYIFDDLLPGVYVVREEARDGWYPTTDMTVDVDVSPLEPFEVTVDFGNAKFGRIIGVKWLDEYMNGIWDGYEPGLPGWVIWIEGTLANGDHYGPYYTLTDINGYYAFDNLLPGVYTVWEELPPGWVNITPSSWTITIIEGSDITCAKFGNVEYGMIDGWKFLDWDMDGLKDGDEPGIPGWAITLTGWVNDGDVPWSPIGATTVGPITVYTDANGYWAFPYLLPGVYTVTEEDRVGWFHTTDPSRTIWITSGWYAYDVKFGNVPYTCIWGYKFEDLNGNGIWDEGEPGLPGWTIVLEGVTNAGVYVYIVMVTDEWGYFETCYNVLPGEYVLYEVIEQQTGWFNTTPSYYFVDMPRSIEPLALYYEFGNFKLGKIYGWKYEDVNGNGVLDGGDEPIPGWTIWLYTPWGAPGWTTTDENGYYEFIGLPAGLYTVVENDRPGWVHMTESFFDVFIMSGSVVELEPFLNVELSTVYGYKFEDLNSNGIWDEGEPGIPRWTIYMIWDLDDTVYVATTDGSGYYEFTGLMPDTFYMVWEAELPGWTPTNETWEIFGIVSGSYIRVHDFGNFKNVTITVFKYDDLEGDGRYDPGIDTPIPGWNVTVSGPGVPGGSVVIQTGPGGYAYLEVATAGTYVVEEEDRDGWCPTTPTVVLVDVLSGMVDPELVMFGNFRCVTITLFKYEDVNSNGVYDDGDEPIPGWTLYLWNGYEVLEVVTGPDGTVTLTFCTADYWYIWEDEPDGWCQITPAEGGYTILVLSGVVYNVDTQEEQYWFEFGNFECVEIIVFKYWDTCSNGWYDPEVGDVPLPRWWIGLYDASGALIEWDYTDGDGYVYFTICRAGVYYVVEELREGWSPITPPEGMYEIEVVSGDEPYLLWFGNYEHVDVPIFKYEDVNSNGVYDEGDRPLPDWYFEMERVGGGATYSGYTDPDGYLVLTVNRSGIYELTEEDRYGWTHVNPASGTRLVSVTSGIVVPLQMFGNFHNVTIIVFKFDDIMADGQYEPWEGDVPVPGWTFWLWKETSPGVWTLVGTAVTDASGYALFWITSAGNYKVEEEARVGWTWILPRDGVYWFSVHSCMGEIEFVFANFKKGTIFGWKWNDLNGDGNWDEGEPPLPGWTIWFEGALGGGGGGGGYISGSATTDANGYYEFTGLPPGHYTVWEIVQGGWMATSPPEVEVDVWGHAEIRIDFLNFQRGCIWGYKYEDMNGNGVYDEGDVPLPGWTIYLSITTGVIETPEGPISAIMLLATTTTDADGYYSFCGLGPGIYVVDEESRTGWIHTTAPSETVVMTSGASIRIHDFLNFKLGKICGYKFEDLNSNGLWDDGEPPLPDWPIYLIRDHLDGTTVEYTDADGWFCFDGLEADWYLVWEAELPGWTPTTVTWAIETIISGACIELDPFGNFENVTIPIFKFEDVNGNGLYDEGDDPIGGWEFTVTGPCFDVPLVVYTGEDGWVYVEVTAAGEYLVTEEDLPGWIHTVPVSGSWTVTVSSGVWLKPLKFGNFVLGEITGQKFYDWNMNGIKEEGEPGLANWVVWVNGSLVGGGWLNFTRITDSNGYFSVSGLPAGTYVVSERLEYAPPGWWPTTPPAVLVGVSSGTTAFVSFGNSVTGVIVGYKFYDKDLDGLWDDGEPGLAGWTIVLEGTTDQGVYVYRTAVTDGDGWYMFDLVQPGSYTVTEFLWAGWTNTTPLPVVIDVSGTMVYFEIGVNIGNIRYAWIHGYKFLDTYEQGYPFWPNGMFDEDEYGLGNWEITLEGWTETGERVERVTYTDNMENVGYYEFTEVLPGTYWVNETLLSGYYATRPISNLIMVYPFPQGMVSIVVDFGNLIPSPDPQVNFVLRSGWNLWSAPIQVDGLTASGLLKAIGPTGLVVTQLDKTSGRYLSYVAGDDPEEDFPIVHGQGYFVWLSGGVSFSLTGILVPGSTSALGEGWNIVGYSSMRPTTASQLVQMVDGASAWVVTYLDAETGRYYSYVAGDGPEEDFTVTPGRAYFVWVDGPSTLVYPEL